MAEAPRGADLSSSERAVDILVGVARQTVSADEQLLKRAPTEELRTVVAERSKPVEHHRGAKQAQLELCSAREDKNAAVPMPSRAELVMQPAHSGTTH